MELPVTPALETLEKGHKILVVTHSDADGIISGALAVATLVRLKKEFVLTWCDTFTQEHANDIISYSPDVVWILDMGSAAPHLKSILSVAKVIICDHHLQKEPLPEHPNLININCNSYGIDGATEACGATVVYAVASRVCDPAALIPLVIVAAVGDRQSDRGLLGLNRRIAQEGMRMGLLRACTGLRLFGRQTVGLPYALASSDLPGLNTVEDAINFLGRVGIRGRNPDGSWRTFSELSQEEVTSLQREIVLAMYEAGMTQEQIAQHFCEYYELPGEGYLRYADEYAYLLNACGNYDRVDVGIGLALGAKGYYDRAIELLNRYKQDLRRVFELANTNTKYLEHIACLALPDDVPSTMAGSVASKLLGSPVSRGLPVLVYGRDSSGAVKYSIRFLEKHGVTVHDVAAFVKQRLGIEGGGHKLAGGFHSPKDVPPETVMATINEAIGRLKTNI